MYYKGYNSEPNYLPAPTMTRQVFINKFVYSKWLSSVTDNWLETSSNYSVYVFSSSDDYCLPRQALPPQL